MTEARSGIIALRLKPDLDARLRAAAGGNMSDFVRDAIEAKLAANSGTPPAATRGKRAAASRCAHRQPSGAFCAKCGSVVP